MTPTPYKIAVPEATLTDLHRRLEQTHWPIPIDGAGWDYGANMDYVRKLCDYWRTEYDWRAHERRLNEYPQFRSTVDGVELHFWHVRSPAPSGTALVLIHGWPGSIVEFFELIAPLVDHGFDVVVPSLPGFGFGGQPHDRGWGTARIADAFDTLITAELGYARYGVQGGDWGAGIAGMLAARHPDHVTAIHMNMAFVTAAASRYVEDEEARRSRESFRADETAYSHQQRTRPDSLTVAQSDSPAGLAAWIVEKFRSWSDCEGDVERSFSKDTLLTNLMFYWAPGSVASSARIYYETQHQPDRITERVEAPTGIAHFPAEPFGFPREAVELCFNVTRWTEMSRGGHFAALEEPDLLLTDMIEFFDQVAKTSSANET